MLNYLKYNKIFSPDFLLGNKLVFLLFFILLIHSFSKAQQNLVTNGSFEDLIDCPLGADIQNATGWFSPNYATPDLFNSCVDISQNYSVPINGFGYQPAQDGNGYAGIVTYSYNSSSIIYREYLEKRLEEPLKNNTLYHISFYMNQANNSPLATNNLSFGFVQDTAMQYLENVILPIVYKPNTSIFLDTINWTKVESYQIGTGIENYIIIGNFHDDMSTDTLSSGMPPTDVYYYIDNVSVEEVPVGEENIFTPNNDGLNETWYPASNCFFNWTCEIFNRWGNRVYQFSKNEPGWNGLDSDGNESTDGVYYYRILSNETVKSGFIELIR